MKKTFLLLVLSLMALPTFAENYMGPGSSNSAPSMYNANSPYVGATRLTVKELSARHDDDYVVLEGYIVKKIRGEKFLFRDATGDIQLEIDHKINYMLEGINERTLVQIYGEYDREFFGKDEIEVQSIRILRQ